MKHQDIKADWRLHYYDGSDVWGACVGAIFDIANGLTREGHHVPGEWQFSVGAAGPYPPEEDTLTWLEDYTADEVTAFVDEYLMPMYEVCKRLKLDY